MKQQPAAQQGREAIAAYYACVSFVDENVGMILDALDQAGLADDPAHAAGRRQMTGLLRAGWKAAAPPQTHP
jgi:hypothetical protein